MTGREGLTLVGLVGALVVGPAIPPVVLGVMRLASGLLVGPSLVSSLALGSRVLWWISLWPWFPHLGGVGLGWMRFFRIDFWRRNSDTSDLSENGKGSPKFPNDSAEILFVLVAKPDWNLGIGISASTEFYTDKVFAPLQ